MYHISFEEKAVIEETKSIVTTICKISTDSFLSGHSSQEIKLWVEENNIFVLK